MADNFDFTPGTGKTGSADDVGGVLYARVKLDIGTDGVGTPVVGGAGVVAAGVPRVTLASDDPAVVDLAAIKVLQTSIDGKITACNTGAVVLAAGTAEIGKLAAGTALIGKVSIDQVTANANEVVIKSGTVTAVTAISNALPAGNNNIGNVDIVTVPAPLSTTGGGTEAAALRVTIASDSTGTLTVDTTGTAGLEVIQGTAADLNCTEASAAANAASNSSIDGKITACNTGAVVISSGTVTTVSTVTNLAQLGGTAVSMNEGTVDAGTQRISIATDDDAVAHLATLANRNNGVNAVTDWTAVAQNAVGESGTLDCSTHEGTSIMIQAFLDTTTAHTGTRFIVQTSSNTTGNEDWHDYRSFTALVGTADTDLIEDNPLTAGSTSLTLTAHALTEEAIWIGIEDGVSLADSELIFVASQSANAVVALDGTTNAHAQNTAVFNVAISKVVILDGTVNRARVIVDNTYDNDGSSLNYKVRATDLER